MGYLYENGLGVQTDFRRAFNYYVRAADKKIVPAARGAGVILKAAPRGITQDLSRAKKYLLTAANQNDLVAMFHLADLYVSEGNIREAIRWYERNISIHEDPDSASQLGLLLINGENNPSIPTDRQRAYQLFQFALSRNEKDAWALFGMGVSYIGGEAIDQNIDTAKYYLRLAVQNGGNSEPGIEANKLLEMMENDTQQNQGGCFITTAVCGSFGKPDDCYELTTFRKFRDNWLTNQPDGKSLIAEYYSIAPKIVDNINRLTDSAKIYKNIWKKYLEPCLIFIHNGDNISCKNKYVEMVRELKKNYS